MTSNHLRHKALMLISGLIRLITRPLLDEVPALRRLRGALYAFTMAECGSNLQVSSDAILWGVEHMRFGRDVYVGPRVTIICLDSLTLGDGVLLGPNVVISNGNHVIRDGFFRVSENEARPISIGSGSWIGANVTVVAGVTIGRGVLVGANSVVTRVVQDFDRVGGIPARSIARTET